MKKTFFQTCSFALAILLCYSASVNAKEFTKSATYAEQKTSESPKQLLFSPQNEQIMPILDGNMRFFCQNYKKGISYNSHLYEFGVPNFKPVPIKIEWSEIQGATCYRFYLSKKNDMSDSECFVTFSTNVVLEDLFRSTNYYYQVEAEFPNSIIKSKVFSFRTEDTIRTIYIDGSFNSRDLGGWLTSDGKYRIKQGLVYRGGNIDAITPEGKFKMRNEMGIVLDMDLRGENIGKTKSPLGDTVRYQPFIAPYYENGDTGIQDPEKQSYLKKELLTFTDTANFPVYFHCAIGRDRTGTLAMLLEGLCGVPETSIFMDYEASAFGGQSTENSANMTSFTCSTFKNLYDYVMSWDKITKSFQTACENYCKSIGLTDSDFEAIRTNLLEEAE